MWSDWIERKGITQAALSRTANVDEAQVSRLVRGRAQLSVGALVRLCDALDLSPEERAQALESTAAPLRAVS